ncbi:MAG: hypothetical protein L0Y71_02780 [Gemmataceae bacterium]|nr:hypothetical protein [Gemmataceae bacterium]
MRRMLLTWGICLTGSWAAVSPLAAQDIIQAHGLLRRHGSTEEPQRIVVTMPAPRVEVRDRCKDADDEPRKCCLFGHKRRHEARTAAPLAAVMFAPASLPAVVVQPSVQQPTMTQQITHDFSSLRSAHEMEVHAAGLAAQMAARNAMINAENDAMQRIMERTRGKMETLSKACASSTQAGDSTDAGKATLDETLRKLDERLNRLEELVLLHQQVINNLKKEAK